MDRARKLNVVLTLGIRGQSLFNFVVNRIIENNSPGNIFTTRYCDQCRFSNRIRYRDQRILECKIKVSRLRLINRVTITVAIDWTQHFFNTLRCEMQAPLLV